MQRKHFMIIVIVGLLTFANALFNGFVGDDEIVITKNEFYKSLNNISLLFDKRYIVNSDEYFSDAKGNYGSGEVSYRPVKSLTYFVDYFVWKLNPFGFHLTNILFHFLTVIFLYQLILLISNNEKISLLSALLFLVHPINTEVVCGLSYRGDSLAALLSILSFICYLKAEQKRGFLYLSNLFFLLGVFTKESVVLLPVLIVIHDYFFKGYQLKEILTKKGKSYLGFVIVALFYLYIYGVVFPLSNIGNVYLANQGVLERTGYILQIFYQYIVLIFLPFMVNVLPPLFSPEVFHMVGVKTFLGLGILGCFVIGIIKAFPNKKIISYFLLWFMISYLPVANIVPLVNPMAHRFMYFPMIGLIVIVAYGLEGLIGRLTAGGVTRIELVIKIGLISALSLVTISLSGVWRSNFTVAANLIGNYPNHFKGYSILGIEFFKLRQYDQARDYLEKSLELGAYDPRIYYMLGICTFDDHKRAEGYFKKAIKIQKNYRAAHKGLEELYRNKK